MRRVLLLTGILGGAIPAFAQAVPPSPTPTASTFDDSIVVTASVGPEKRDELPAGTTVIGAPEIERRQATTIAELLATTPGLSLTQAGSPGHVTSLFSRGTDSNHTLVLWNGVPLNDPYNGGFDWGNLPTEGVEKVEIVRGPFSALWGSSALGAVVQVLSAVPAGASVSAEAGNQSYHRGALAAAHDFGALRVELTGHTRRGDGEVRNDFFDSDEAAARATWELTPGTSLGLLARAADNAIGIPGPLSAPTPNQRQATRERELALPFHSLAGAWDIEALLSDTTSDLAYRAPEFFFRSDTSTSSRRVRSSAAYRVSDGLTVAGGGEWQRDEADNSDNFGDDFTGVHRSNWAAFAEARARGERTSTTFGLRRDDNQLYGSHLSPRAGASWRPTDHFSLHAAYGEGFRAPAFVELFFPFSGNPALKPELSRSVEVGGRWESGAWGAGVTAFENRLRDLIDYDFVTGRDFNVGRARTRGLEAEVSWRAKAWEVRWNGTQLDAKDLDTNLDLLRRPHQSANLLVAWSPRDWAWSGEWRYVGERFDFPQIRLPSYTAFDLAVAWRHSALWQPYLRLRNALDRRYEAAVGYPAPRRTIATGVSVHF